MRGALVGSAAVFVILAATFASASCSSNPVNVPVRTFERAQKVDVVCMRVRGTTFDVNGFTTPLSPVPLPQAACAPVPPNTDGSQLPNHLYALVTQTARGELAVVDLTSGNVVDEDRKTPGINFIPVGAQPTDVAASPDGKMVFVSAAEPNKPAIYGLASTRVLGDSLGLPLALTPAPLTLPALPACLLPQQPMAITIVPRVASAGAGADAGAGNDGGTSAPSAGYELAVVLAGTGKTSAKIAMIDPLSLARGAGVEESAGATIAPGSLTPCVVTSSIELSAQLGVAAGAPAATWDDGVKYVDGGVDLRDAEPSLGATCASAPVDGGINGDGGGDAGDGGVSDAGDAGADEGGARDAGSGPARNDAARPSATAFDADHLVLYVADGALPLIHAIDVSVPGASRELPPLLVTSESDPARQVVVSGLSISPTTRDFKRFLYAIDAKEGSLAVFEVTDVPTAPRLPMHRPHPELNPFQPTDRILFSAPVAAVSFVKHDWALTTTATTTLVAAKTGLLCNPNPNANPNAPPNDPATSDDDLGANYRANATGQVVALGPYKLRGVFAFATLSNGIMVTIDVDDWDAPCRRPDPMGLGDKIDKRVVGTQTSDVAPPEPAAAAGDKNPYHAPVAYPLTPINPGSPVTLEASFPSSAPHHARSTYLLRADPQAGINIPNLVGLPQLVANNAVKATTGDEGRNNPILLPTYSTIADPTYVANPTEPDPTKRQSSLPPGSVQPHDTAFSLPVVSTKANSGNTTPGVRFAFEDPQVHINQDWTVTYEGIIPGLDGIAATVEPRDAANLATDYRVLSLFAPNALFCRRGVEDQRIGTQRVAARNAELDRLKLPRPSAKIPGSTSSLGAESWTADYVQIADDILASDNPYWGTDEGDSCWDPSLSNAQSRHDACQSTYGSLTDTVPSLFRDFPILEAYEDRFVIGRYGYQDPSNPSTVNRIVVGKDDSNVAALKLMRCCFHHQVNFKVRTGGQWVAVGSASGLLHHVRAAAASDMSSAAPGACVLSCDPRDALLNGRAAEVPRPAPATAVDNPPDRNSALSMRNPMFAFILWGGAPPPAPSTTVPAPGFTTTQRDYQWRFSTRGQFAPLTVNIGGNTTEVAPQSMLFIESLGQLAVVDGASQGLVLIDLNTVAFAHSPFF
jgi:hypothetical protein